MGSLQQDGGNGRGTKRQRVEDDNGNTRAFNETVGQGDNMQSMATLGKQNGMAQGTGSAWEGQMQSLATDAFKHNSFESMRNDVHTSIVTSGHIMDQGGAICSGWTALPGIATTLDISMGDMTGNTLMGEANLFNQYYLARLNSFKVIFKDIVVVLEASTSVGLTTMADVVTEWRVRPKLSYVVGLDLANADYPNWWMDWRPATDGAVEFHFPVHGANVPAFLASARKSNPTSAPYKDRTSYRTLGQYVYGETRVENFQQISASARYGDFGSDTGAGLVSYNPYCAAQTHHWLDYFFEWRARNCPNNTSAAVTSARYNIQIDASWDMSHRVTSINNTRFFTPPARNVNEGERLFGLLGIDTDEE